MKETGSGLINFALFIFMGLNSLAFNQVVTGTVIDKDTRETIPFATIYFGGTFVGTSADQEGNFSIDISEYVSMPLNISAIGYFNNTLINPDGNEHSIVYLEPKVYEINEVMVKTKSLARQKKRNLRQFRFVFIGSRMHFLRALWTNELERNSYEITYSNEVLVETNSLVHLLDNGDKTLRYPDKLLIGYRQSCYSEISFLTGQVFFGEDGSFDSAGIGWYGDMGKFRIADWLPYDYSVRNGLN